VTEPADEPTQLWAAEALLSELTPSWTDERR
jgi:hypothetical protein